LNFLILDKKYKHKTNYDFSTAKLLANVHDFDIFSENLNFKRWQKKLTIIRNLVFNFKVLFEYPKYFIDIYRLKNSQNNSKKAKIFWKFYCI